MDHFQEIFTLPESSVPEYDPRENVLNQIRWMEDGENDEQMPVLGNLLTNFKRLKLAICMNRNRVQLVDKFLKYLKLLKYLYNQ